MDTNALLREAGITPNVVADFPSIARFAADLAAEGESDANILIAVRVRLGFSLDDRVTMLSEPAPLTVFGEVGGEADIDIATMAQMRTVMSLPVADRGALMPDGHVGYAMPIGGVVRLHNAVSPSFVGYDIACRMMLSILDIAPAEFMARREYFAEAMRHVTSFGLGSDFKAGERDHWIMDDERWKVIPAAWAVFAKARKQLGSSGGGNHFFDALVGRVIEEVPWMAGYRKGDPFVAIMSHSGSRGAGHALATYFQKVAQEYTKQAATGIPKGYEWLGLDSLGGQEYWEAMELMGLYAEANHWLIHHHFSKWAGVGQAKQYQNHHNFAWKETDGEENFNGFVIHRKGATPAEEGQIGIIPGSSGAPSYLVEGLGEPSSLFSSSHGAGRRMSRKAAKAQAAADPGLRSDADMRFGVSDDEMPFAYKDIERVIALQEGRLVKVIAKMEPVIVVMGGRSDDGD